MRRIPCGLLAILAVAAGCARGPYSPADVDRGRQAVIAALDGWKARDPAGRLKDRPDPVDFSEDLARAHTLLDYSLGPTDATDPQNLRYTVRLKLRNAKGKVSEREVAYAVELRSPVRVVRDPYF